MGLRKPQGPGLTPDFFFFFGGGGGGGREGGREERESFHCRAHRACICLQRPSL